MEGYDKVYDGSSMLFMDFRRHHSGVWAGAAPRRAARAAAVSSSAGQAQRKLHEQFANGAMMLSSVLGTCQAARVTCKAAKCTSPWRAAPVWTCFVWC